MDHIPEPRRVVPPHSWDGVAAGVDASEREQFGGAGRTLQISRPSLSRVGRNGWFERAVSISPAKSAENAESPFLTMKGMKQIGCGTIVPCTTSL